MMVGCYHAREIQESKVLVTLFYYIHNSQLSDLMHTTSNTAQIYRLYNRIGVWAHWPTSELRDPCQEQHSRPSNHIIITNNARVIRNLETVAKTKIIENKQVFL